MAAAMEEAHKAAVRDEVPIGAILADHETGQILAASGNKNIELSDPSAHAEIIVIRQLCKQRKVQRLPDCDLIVTLEPCTMCAAAISFARIRRIIFAASDPKSGGIINGVKFYEQATCHHRPLISHGIMSEESAELLKNFFRTKRT